MAAPAELIQMQIWVFHRDRALAPVDVALGDTIQAIKQRISATHSYLSEYMMLTLRDQDHTILEDEQVWSHYKPTPVVFVDVTLLRPAGNMMGGGLINVNVKTLTGKTIAIQIHSHASVDELKLAVQVAGGIPPDQQRLVFHGKTMEPHLVLDAFPVRDHDVVHVVLRLGGGPRNYHWQPFLKQHAPAAFERNVPLVSRATTIMFRFQPSQGRIISLEDIDGSSESSDPSQNSNQWHEYIDQEDVPAAFWTDRMYRQRLMVIKLRPEFARHGADMQRVLDAKRYLLEGVNQTYYGGDSRSWQRYTLEQPLPGKLVTDHSRQQVSLELDVQLEPRTWYAAVLLHLGVGTIIEDFIVPFETSDVSASEVPALHCCRICYERPLGIAYQCGHMVCSTCDYRNSNSDACPQCRQVIQQRIKLRA